jgi:hypothetical protein
MVSAPATRAKTALRGMVSFLDPIRRRSGFERLQPQRIDPSR